MYYNLKKIVKTVEKYNRLIVIIVGFSMFLILITVLLINNDYKSDNKFIIEKNDIDKSDSDTIEIRGSNEAKVYINNKKKVEKINVEDYIIGVVASEMPITFDEEALKAQAVAARTFYYSKRLDNCSEAHGGEICSSVHCQTYMKKNEAQKKWPKQKRDEYWKRAEDAVNATKNQVMTYDDEILKYPQFFAVSSGRTENAIDVFSEEVPYLKSTDSKGEQVAPKYESEVKISMSEFIRKINQTYSDANLGLNNINDINILSRTDGGSVKEIKIGNKIITGIQFRKIFDINSANFTISIHEKSVKICCKGYGHGVGMSQWGAKIMADNGSNYQDILKHYYSGVEIKKIEYK